MLQSFTKKEHIFWIASGYHLVVASQSIPNVGLNKNHIIFPLSISTFGCPPPQKKKHKLHSLPFPKNHTAFRKWKRQLSKLRLACSLVASPASRSISGSPPPYHHPQLRRMIRIPRMDWWYGSPGGVIVWKMPPWGCFDKHWTLSQDIGIQIGWFSEHIWIQL